MENRRLWDFGLVALAMLSFAGNSLLCRLALRQTEIDPATFTGIRLVAGALFLAFLVWRRGARAEGSGVSWLSALALFTYAAAFSYAYLGLTAATGALILFGAVQISMTAAGVARGERPSGRQAAGIALALGGLCYLLLPGVEAPPVASAGLMIAAGIAWAIYSLRGRRSGDPLATTAGNFRLAVAPALALSVAALPHATLDARGFAYAVASGAITSGAGYAVWYAVLPRLAATQAAVVQLTVPVIAAFGAVLLLGETPTLRLAIAAAVVLGGVAMTLRRQA